MASIIDDPSDRTKRNRFHKKKKETNKDRLFEVGWANCGDSSPASMQKRARRWPRSKLRRRKKKELGAAFHLDVLSKKKTPSESASALQPAVSNPSVARIPPSGATSEMKHKNKEKTNKNETLAVATPETALGVATPRERPISFESQSARRRCRDRRPVDITTRRGGFNYRPRL